MRSYKSIERPAQVLGMNLPDLGLVVGLFLASVLAIGIAGLVVSVPRFIYLLTLVLLVALLYGLRYLAKHRPPGFLLSWLSFHRRQPRRIALGRPRSGPAAGARPAPSFPHEHFHR
jgi:type IV secretory pathway VirB3-like protein